MDQTSRSRRGAPLPLCIAFRSSHRFEKPTRIEHHTTDTQQMEPFLPQPKVPTVNKVATVYETHNRQLSNKSSSLRASHNGNSASTDRILLSWRWKPVRLSSSAFLSGHTPSKSGARVNERPRRHVALRTTLQTSSSDGRCAE